MSRAYVYLALPAVLFTLAATLALGDRQAHAAPVPTTTTATRTSNAAASLSREDMELARYIDLLEDLDLLENLDMVELLPVLEDSDAN